MEEIIVLERLWTTSNPGKIWEKWKPKMKKQLQAIERKIAQDSRHDFDSTKRILEATAHQYCEKDTPQSRLLFDSSLQHYRNSVESKARYSQDENFDHHMRHIKTSSQNFPVLRIVHVVACRSKMFLKNVPP
uniref:AlNc14C80G5250 protein n=1 Tax=Albugo laibachii Nc14 TaxID=890382 RepID=F0WF56_9STRA|nr:AlNc14C80G5250 [Albugo laibachii Nc14]|eukprot:CCA19838.1 AlNc14C80G5250 [Albugo laibachii Nc14]